MRGKRKFILAIIIIVVSLIIGIIEGIDSNISYIILGTFAIFTGGNSIEHLKK